jgi:hypothetical protein
MAETEMCETPGCGNTFVVVPGDEMYPHLCVKCAIAKWSAENGQSR